MINARAVKEQVNQFSCVCILASQETEAHWPGYAVVFHPDVDVFFFFSPVFALLSYVSETAAHSDGVLAKLSACASPRVCACLCVPIRVSLCDLVRSVSI